MTDTRDEVMLEHLHHMAEVRPAGLDRDAAKWAFDELVSLSGKAIAERIARDTLADRIATISHQLAEAQGYATRLATFLWEEHWKQDAPEWKPLPDLIGVLTQIDNACAGLVRADKHHSAAMGTTKP